MNTSITIDDRFEGCLLGLAVGDALGAHFEGQPPEYIGERYRSVDALIQNPPPGEIWYTDDTQMMIGVAETLVNCSAIEETELCNRFAANYVPQRGYGRGARVVLEAMVDGHDHKYLAAEYFPGGSFGNGAAMRVAPVGLVFRHDEKRLWDQAKLSALPTHVHPLGIEGAQLLALAVGLASTCQKLNREEFLNRLAEQCTSLEYSGPLRRSAKITNPKDLGLMGNGIEATSSVVTAIASFAMTPESYEETIGNVILLGGDTDTIAAMAGAVCGAYMGPKTIPEHLLDSLEDHHQGKSYIRELATKLSMIHQRITENDTT